MNKEANRRAVNISNDMGAFTDKELRELAKLLGAQTSRLKRGAVKYNYNREELIHSIRSAIGRGTFPDRLDRFSSHAEHLLSNK